MKYITPFLFALVFLLVTGCSDNELVHTVADKENLLVEEENAPIVEGVKSLTLTEPGFPLALYFPDRYAEPSVKFNPSFGRMEVKQGNSFSYFITETKCPVNRIREGLGYGVFVIDFLQDNDSTLYYRSALPDGSSANYHFCKCLIRDKMTFVFSDDQTVIFNKSQTDKMIEFIDMTSSTTLIGSK